MTTTRQRLSILIGSESAFSRPVLIGLGIVGFFLSFMYIRLIPDQSVIVAFAASVGAALISVAVLILARERGYRDGWSRPHVGIVLGGLIVASLVRSLANSLFVAWQTSGRELDSSPVSRSLAALVVTLVLGVVMMASAQLSRERADANAGLLAEQARLRALVESADRELVHSEAELRGRARVLLEPTINEIRELISEEIAETDAQQLSDRINAAVNDVVRPASRELARSPFIDPGMAVGEAHAPLAFLRDRMDITTAIKPGWLLALAWGVLLPAALLRGADTSARIGPRRAVSSGDISSASMRRGIWIACLLALVLGTPVAVLSPWLLLAGFLAIACALAYTLGPFPLAYRGLGDVFVVACFGVQATVLTAWALSQGTTVIMPWMPALLAGLGLGLLADNILVANNARDYETDLVVGKRTTVVRVGRGFARNLHGLNSALGLACLGHVFGWAPMALLPLAIWQHIVFRKAAQPADFLPFLGRAAVLMLLATILCVTATCLGWVPADSLWMR